jgi:hypothetical protein
MSDDDGWQDELRQAVSLSISSEQHNPSRARQPLKKSKSLSRTILMIRNVMPPNPMVEQPASERTLLPGSQPNSPVSQQSASQLCHSIEESPPVGASGQNWLQGVSGAR